MRAGEVRGDRRERPAHYDFGPIDYPDSYDSPFPIIDGKKKRFTYGLSDPSRHQFYCSFCSFRGWADTGEIDTIRLTVTRADGTVEVFDAPTEIAPGRYRFALDTRPGNVAEVRPGDVRDRFGNTNG